MSGAFAAVTRQQLPELEAGLSRLGALQSITFHGVGPGGADIYEASFQKGKLELRMRLSDDGVIQGVGVRPIS